MASLIISLRPIIATSQSTQRNRVSFSVSSEFPIIKSSTCKLATVGSENVCNDETINFAATSNATLKAIRDLWKCEVSSKVTRVDLMQISGIHFVFPCVLNSITNDTLDSGPGEKSLIEYSLRNNLIN